MHVDLESVESRVSLLRKTVPPQVIRTASPTTLRRADQYLRELAGKGMNDLVGEFVHPPIEFFLTRLVAYTPLTPNYISYLIILLSLAGLYFFFSGQFWAGIGVNLVRVCAKAKTATYSTTAPIRCIFLCYSCPWVTPCAAMMYSRCRP